MDGPKHRARSREEGAGSTQDQEGRLHKTATEERARGAGEGNDVAGKGKAPARDSRKGRGCRSEGGVDEQPESRGNSVVSKV